MNLALAEQQGLILIMKKHNMKSCERMASLCCCGVRTDVAQL